MKTERLYYLDSYLKTFQARVVGRTTIEGRPAVVLDRTAFYPTSGGQPNDTGYLSGVPVVDVVDCGETIVHVLGGSPPALEAVAGQIDWPRRLDHMQQHTGQHILSQSLDRLVQAPTVSFHLADEYCTIDVARTPLSADEVRRVEELANQIVLEDRPVRVHLVAPDDLGRYALRKETSREDEVRVVEVEDFDFSACGGTHCDRTGRVGPVKVRRWERRGGETRIEFLCGWRALRDYGWKHDLVRSLAEGFRVRDRDVGGAVQRALDELASARDALEDLRERLRGYEVAELLESASPVPAGAAVARLVVHSSGDRSPEELKRLAQRLTAVGDVVALLGLRVGDGVRLVFAQSPGLPFDMAALLKAASARLGGRGGGTRDLAQGGAPQVGGLDDALAEAADKLRLWSTGCITPLPLC